MGVNKPPILADSASFASVSVGGRCDNSCDTSGLKNSMSQPGDTRSIIEAKPTRIRLWRAGGLPVVLENPTIVGDSLVGTSTDQQRSGSVRYRVATPLDQIRAVETRGIDGGKTALAVLGVGALVAVIVAVATAESEPEPARRTSTCSDSDCYSCPLVYSWDGETWRLDSLLRLLDADRPFPEQCAVPRPTEGL